MLLFVLGPIEYEACERGCETAPSCKGAESLLIVDDRSSILETGSRCALWEWYESSLIGAQFGVEGDEGRDLLGGSCIGSSSSSANLQVPFSRWYFRPFGLRYALNRTTSKNLLQDLIKEELKLTLTHPFFWNQKVKMMSGDYK